VVKIAGTRLWHGIKERSQKGFRRKTRGKMEEMEATYKVD
jgi:hypothetical protein